MDEVKNILSLTCLKHIKIYKLKQLGKTNKEIAELVGTNAGHVYNALKAYDTNPEKKIKADSLIA